MYTIEKQAFFDSVAAGNKLETVLTFTDLRKIYSVKEIFYPTFLEDIANNLLNPKDFYSNLSIDYLELLVYLGCNFSTIEFNSDMHINDRPDLIEFYLKNNFDIHKLSTRGYSMFSLIIIKQDLEGFEAYLNSFSDINESLDSEDNTLLHLVCRFSSDTGTESIDMLRILIKAGADVNKPNNKGNTPLFLAVYSDNLYVIEYILSVGANINHKNNQEHSVLFFALHSTKMLELLLSKNPEVLNTQYADDKEHKTVITYARYTRRKESYNILTKYLSDTQTKYSGSILSYNNMDHMDHHKVMSFFNQRQINSESVYFTDLNVYEQAYILQLHRKDSFSFGVLDLEHIYKFLYKDETKIIPLSQSVGIVLIDLMRIAAKNTLGEKWEEGYEKILSEYAHVVKPLAEEDMILDPFEVYFMI